jgi:hypothetical protein
MSALAANGSHTQLADALVAAFGAGCSRIEQSSFRLWESATFSGARHSFRIRTANWAAGERLGSLADHPFDLRGHLVADISARAADRAGPEGVIEVEALTVEER